MGGKKTFTLFFWGRCAAGPIVSLWCMDMVKPHKQPPEAGWSSRLLSVERMSINLIVIFVSSRKKGGLVVVYDRLSILYSFIWLFLSLCDSKVQGLAIIQRAESWHANIFISVGTKHLLTIWWALYCLRKGTVTFKSGICFLIVSYIEIYILMMV